MDLSPLVFLCLPEGWFFGVVFPVQEKEVALAQECEGEETSCM